MQIVLLSGGSGKRLWPLSNDVRSKQFIKMLQGEDGNSESMIMRVYRQIKAVNKDANILIATGKKQVSSIRNQLNDKVSVCIEPERRDTFPAIGLAASYLYDVMKVDREEAVVICPVDPYVEEAYFELVCEMAKLVEENTQKLVLMGIKPTYPSEKYGYIIPTSTERISNVDSFREKPDLETAKAYLEKGALWNGGVFACKLGYLLDKAHEGMEFDDYCDLFANYGAQKKISFDYAVVEREQSIRVITYEGTWKDLGTWNTFSEAMNQDTLGKVILSDTCDSTQVINELNLPILCMGCKNMVIAASTDGILISDKKESSYIKPYVEGMDGEARFAEKSWGSFTVLDVQEGCMTIKVELIAEHSLYYHSHEYRDEVWTVAAGEGLVLLNDETFAVKVGDVVRIPAGAKHTIYAKTKLQLIEVQTGNEISVDDKKKYELPANCGFTRI